ncbi:hypothetical protein IJ596_01745 [bacterium]|nr:hypothetical protein [bacterium]
MYIPPKKPLSPVEIAKALLKVKYPTTKQPKNEIDIYKTQQAAADIIETDLNKTSKHKKEQQIVNVWI